MALKTFSLAGSLLIAGLAGWAVLSPQIKDGIIIKFGLILISVGSLGLGYIVWKVEASPLLHALGMIYLGHAFVFIGWVFRAKRGQAHFRRVTDWADLGDTPGVR